MKTFLTLATERQSDRAYENRPIPREILEHILEAGHLAPSACNAQPWKIIVVSNEAKRVAIADATSSKILKMNHFTKQAPIQLVIVEESANFSSTFGGGVKQKHFPHIDIGILTSQLVLAAEDEGIGSCIIGWFNEKKIKKTLEIPDKKRVLLIITLGYSAQPKRTKKRKPINEIVSYEKY